VLGFDTEISRDHHWGPRVLLFLSTRDYPKLKDNISDTLSHQLPYQFLGYSTNYSKPDLKGIRRPVVIKHGPIVHMVNIYTVRSFFQARLGFDPARTITLADWLTFPQQRLLELTAGAVYHDGLGSLKKIRAQLEYYPKDIWLYLLSAQWTRLSQEEAFVGRTGDVGDELGSQVVAARMVREVMKLGFLMERKYAPYSKWLGSAFQNLRMAKTLTPILRRVLLAETWKTREKWLAQAYSLMAKRHNALKITKPIKTDPANYYSRPYKVIFAERFAVALKQAIRNPAVKKLQTDVGSIISPTAPTSLRICR